MKALLNAEQGNLVVQVEPDDNIFPVATSLTWIDCPDYIVAYQYTYQQNIFVPYVAPQVIPTTVSMRQARLALFQDGLLNQVQTAIDAMAEPAKTTTQISWDYATVVNRDDDLVVQLSAQLGLTSEDLDALFILAATL
jgi:hypothetical protein